MSFCLKSRRGQSNDVLFTSLRNTKCLETSWILLFSRYRSILGGVLGPAFGIDLIVDKPGTIHVGDKIHVIRGDNITPP